MHRFPYWPLSSYYFCYFAFLGAFTPYFGLYLQSLSFSAWEIGVLMSQLQLMRVFGPYLWGILADRSGKRLLIIRLTSIVTLIASLLLFHIRHFSALFVVLAILSFFWVAALPLIETLTFDHLRENSSGYSRVRIWGSVGFILTVLGVGAVLDHFGLSSLLWLIALTLAGIMFNGLLVPEAPPHAFHGQHPPVSQIVRQPRVIALFAACFAMAAAHGVLNIFYSIFLSDQGYSKSQVGALWSLAVLAEIVVFFFMPHLMRRFSLRHILLVSFAAASVRFAMIGWGVHSPSVIVLAQLMHGLTFSSFHSSAIAVVNRWFAGSTRARGQALYSSVSFGAGGFVGGLTSAWTWELLGGELTFALSSLYGLLGLLLIAWGVHEGREHAPELSSGNALADSPAEL